MRPSIISLAAGTLMLGFGTLDAQQAPAPPAEAPPVVNQPEPRNPANRLQPNQQGIRQRAPQRQPFAPFNNRNNRNPREAAAADQAQQGQPSNDQGQSEVDLNQIVSDGGGGGGYSYMSSSTIEEGRGRAAADVVRSAGEYNRNTATAAVLQEHARDKAIDNHYKNVDNYFLVRQLNRQERNEERGRMPTQEDVTRYNQSRLPERLSLTELDRHTGAIHWPVALLAPEFDEHRARLEQIFQARSYTNSGLGSPSYVEIKQETEGMLATLQDRVREVDPAAYVQARRFVVSLGFEGRFMAGDDRVALRS